jgi:hypothetical protein
MPNWRKLPSSLYMNRGRNAWIAANAAKNTRMEKDVMCRLMKNWLNCKLNDICCCVLVVVVMMCFNDAM